MEQTQHRIRKEQLEKDWESIMSDKPLDYRGIGDLRKSLGEKQLKVAEKSGISQSLLSKYEKGTVKTPSYQHLKSIAGALNVSLDDLEKACEDFDEPLIKPRTIIAGPKLENIPVYERRIMVDGSPVEDVVHAEPGSNIGEIQKPAFLGPAGGTCIRMPSDMMEPRFRKGDQLFADPTLVPEEGDDVWVTMLVDNQAIGFIRELETINGDIYTLISLQDDRDLAITKGEFVSMDVIVGTIRNR